MTKYEEDLLSKSRSEEEEKKVIEVPSVTTSFDPVAGNDSVKSDINHAIIDTLDKEFAKLVLEENENQRNDSESQKENPEEIDQFQQGDGVDAVEEDNENREGENAIQDVCRVEVIQNQDGWTVDEKEKEKVDGWTVDEVHGDRDGWMVTDNEKVDGWNLDEVNENPEGWTAIESENENQEGATKELKGKPKKSQFPNRPGEPDCTFYLKTGSCGFGSNCKFNHPPQKKHKVRSLSNESQDSVQVVEEKVENPRRVGQLECKYYLTPGGCKFGKACRYHHPREKNVPVGAPVEFNFLGLPIRPGQRECPFYMRTGSCKFATSCRFNHPDPTAGGSESVYEMASSAPLHSSTDPQSAVTSWSIPQPSTDTIPYSNSSQSYMPTMLQPQGMHLSMEWNRYQAPVRPLYPPHPSMVPALHQMPVDEYPERPGQKECQFYMKTGDCKYKTSCRFHHPKAQAQAQVHTQAPSAAAMSPNLSPLGLPLRPDQIICTHFSRFGTCKYGSACKYDHTPNPNSPALQVSSGSGPLPYYHNPVTFVRGPMGNGGDGNTGYVQQPV